jgi:hypothetical protein
MKGVRSGMLLLSVTIGLLLLSGGAISVVAVDNIGFRQSEFSRFTPDFPGYFLDKDKIIENQSSRYWRRSLNSTCLNIRSKLLNDSTSSPSMASHIQSPFIERTWQRPLGGTDTDKVWSSLQSIDGGFIIGGYTWSNDGDVSGNHGKVDAWIVKLNDAGTLVWQKCYGGSDYDGTRSIIQTSDGGFLLTGSTGSNDGDVSGNHGRDDLWVVKIDSMGNIIWQKCLGGTDDESASSVVETIDGGFLVAGNTRSNDGDVSGNHGEEDFWVVKLDNTGNIIWQKCLGGSDYDEANSVYQTHDGNYLIGGMTYSSDGDVTYNHGWSDYWIVKIDQSGNILWEKSFGGSSSDAAFQIIETFDEKYIVVGGSLSTDGDVTSNHGFVDYWLVKLDSDGSIIWDKSFGGTSLDVPMSIIQTFDKGFLVCGYTMSNDDDVSGNHGSSDYWIIKLDNYGNLLWQECLGGSYYDDAYSITPLSDGRYLIAGDTSSNDGDVSGNHGWEDFWVVMVTPLHTIESSSDSWSVVHPYGNLSYIENSDANYLTQGKPGAILDDVIVNGTSQGPLLNYTFSSIEKNHTISTNGSPIPGQIHAMFQISNPIGTNPLNVIFIDLSVGNPTSWEWQFGDGSISYKQNPEHEYKVPGTYTVSLRAFNEKTGGYTVCNGCVTVNP